MSKITIIEPNTNDKDQIRNYLVKGERGDDGVSPTVETSKTGDTATITITDAEGTHEVELKDGVSPTVETSKTGKVTTVTITDAEGTHTATINDGLDGATTNIIDNATLTDNTTQTYSGRIVDSKLSNYFLNGNLTVIRTTITLGANETTATSFLDLPTGYTNANTIILSSMMSQTDDYYANEPTTNYMYIQNNVIYPIITVSIGSLVYPQGEDKLTIVYHESSSISSSRTRYLSIVLLKTS